MTIDVNSINSTPLRTGEKPATEQAQQNAHSVDKKDAGQQQTESTVKISDRTEMLQKLEKTIESLPVVDAQKVESIKQAIIEGRYEINAERIVDKMIAFEKDIDKTE